LIQIIPQEESEEIRLLASICLKNCLKRCWNQRGGGNRTLEEEEREGLKGCILDMVLNEPSDRVSYQLSLCVGKIARSDWPYNWDGLFEGLADQATNPPSNSSNDFSLDWVVRRSLYVMYRILVELSHGKLKRMRELFESACFQLWDVISPIWNQKMNQLEKIMSNGGDGSINDIFSEFGDEWMVAHCCLISSKILLLMFGSGFGDEFKSTDLSPFFEGFTSHVIEFRKLLRSSSIADELCENERDIKEEAGPSQSISTIFIKLLKSLFQLPTEAQNNFPLAFTSYLAPFLDFQSNMVLNIFEFNHKFHGLFFS